MSVRIMSAVWDIDLPDSEKIVLLALADCANDEGHCWPGMKSLCRKTSKSERTVQGCIQRLVNDGHLSRREVFGKGCNYTVHPRSGCAPADIAPPQGLRDTPAAAAGKPSKNHNTSGAKAPSVARAKPKLQFEAAFPNDVVIHAFRVSCVQWAAENMKWSAADAGREFDSFRDGAVAHDRAYADWLAAWRNWCRSEYCKTKAAGTDGYNPFRYAP